MAHPRKTLALLCVTAGLLTACAAKPPSVQTIPDTADVTQEIESTQKQLDQAKASNLDILAPKSYERAQVRLNEAREMALEGKRKERILKNVAESRGWLQEAESKGEVTRASMKGLSDARTGAIRANAPNIYAKELTKLDDEARDIAEDAERGNLLKANTQGERLANQYRELEIRSLTKNFLTEADENLKAAKKDDAEKHSPKTYRQVETKINQTISLIHSSPDNIDAISRAAKDATEDSKFLLAVNQQTKAGNNEDLVLQAEQQKRELSGMAVGLAATQQELQKKEAAEKTANQLRSQLAPTEADVYVEGNAVKVRLKALQFGANKTDLNKKSTSLIEKVERALGTVGVSQVIVEGHTDSIGDSDVNQDISQKRAEAVQNYMANSGRFAPDKLKAIGRGEEDPISDNKTPRGRSQNRRIDLLIQPEVESRVE